MSPTTDQVGWIELLYDKEFVSRLQIDLQMSPTCLLNVLSLTPVLSQVFESFLLQKKQLTIIANHPSKNSSGIINPYEIREDLRRQGATVTFYRAPWLCHEKIVLLPPGIVYLGSHNFSFKSLFHNHETTVRFFSPSILLKLQKRLTSRIQPNSSKR